MVVRPRSVSPGDSWAFCLSFALQLALVLLVPVGSLLPFGSHPSRWGHPCGVEASLSSIGTKVLCFSFPFGLFLHVVIAFGMRSPYGSGVGLVRPPLVVGAAPFLLMVGLRTSVCGFSSRPALQVGFLVVLAEAESLRLSLALSSVLPCPMLWLHVRLHDPCSGSVVVLGALH